MKLIVTSATMDAQKFADFFGNVPTFQVRVIAFVFNCVRLKWVKKFVSVLCLQASHESIFSLSFFFLVGLRQKGFLARLATATLSSLVIVKARYLIVCVLQRTWL